MPYIKLSPAVNLISIKIDFDLSPRIAKNIMLMPNIATNLAFTFISMLRNQPRTSTMKPTTATNHRFNSPIQSDPSSNAKHHKERRV